MLCAEHDSLRQEHRVAVQNFRAAIHDLLTIYTYPSAIPCIEGPTDPKNQQHNDYK